MISMNTIVMNVLKESSKKLKAHKSKEQRTKPRDSLMLLVIVRVLRVGTGCLDSHKAMFCFFLLMIWWKVVLRRFKREMTMRKRNKKTQETL